MDSILIILEKKNGPRASSAPILGLGVQISVRPFVRPSVRSCVRPSVNIYVEVWFSRHQR